MSNLQVIGISKIVVTLTRIFIISMDLYFDGSFGFPPSDGLHEAKISLLHKFACMCVCGSCGMCVCGSCGMCVCGTCGM